MKFLRRLICRFHGHRWAWQHVAETNSLGWKGAHGPCTWCDAKSTADQGTTNSTR